MGCHGRCSLNVLSPWPSSVSSSHYSSVLDALCRSNPACDRGRLTESTRLLDEGLLDSLQIVTMIGELETALACRVPLDEVVPDNFQDLNSICALVDRCLPPTTSPTGSP